MMHNGPFMNFKKDRIGGIRAGPHLDFIGQDDGTVIEAAFNIPDAPKVFRGLTELPLVVRTANGAADVKVTLTSPADCK